MPLTLTLTAGAITCFFLSISALSLVFTKMCRAHAIAICN